MVTGRPIRIAGSRQNAALSSCIWGALAAGKEAGGYDSVDEAAERMGNLQDKTYFQMLKIKKNTTDYTENTNWCMTILAEDRMML